MPVVDDKMDIDWKNPGDFEFSYEIGLAPDFDVKLSAKDKYTYYKVKVDKTLVDKQLDDFAKRYGKTIFNGRK